MLIPSWDTFYWRALDPLRMEALDPLLLDGTEFHRSLRSSPSEAFPSFSIVFFSGSPRAMHDISLLINDWKGQMLDHLATKTQAK
jgi:hypothetical protein